MDGQVLIIVCPEIIGLTPAQCFLLHLISLLSSSHPGHVRSDVNSIVVRLFSHLKWSSPPSREISLSFGVSFPS